MAAHAWRTPTPCTFHWVHCRSRARCVAHVAQVEKLMGVAQKALHFRREQEADLGWTDGCAHCQAKKLGDVTTLNLTMLDAGVSLDG